VTRVLVIEDDERLRGVLDTILSGYGYDVDGAASGEAGLAAASTLAPDVVVLDLGLPGIDGFEVLRRLRTLGRAKVVVLSALQDSADKVSALDAGADDYVSKPFDTAELLARLRAVLRRNEEPSAGTIRCGDLEIDLPRSLVTRGGEAVRLTPTEYRLLELLVSKRGSLVRHEQIARELWGPDGDHDRTTVRVFVRQLRAKLGDGGSEPRLIENEPGRGYRWIGPVAELADEPVPKR
jgi:two-component system, OmpR family, KDP operon response regulator KdpE